MVRSYHIEVNAIWTETGDEVRYAYDEHTFSTSTWVVLMWVDRRRFTNDDA
jgi:hypothetical protein